MKRLKGTSENVFGETHSGTVPEGSYLQTSRIYGGAVHALAGPLKDETIGPAAEESV